MCSQLLSFPCPSFGPKRELGPDCAEVAQGADVEVWRLLNGQKGSRRRAQDTLSTSNTSDMLESH